MHSEIPELGELLAAAVAFLFVLCVREFVSAQVIQHVEAAVAQVAHEIRLFRVPLHVSQQMRAPTERAFTLCTRPFLRIQVGLLMAVQVRRRTERLMAVFANVCLLVALVDVTNVL